MTTVRISTTSGGVRVLAEERHDTAIDGHARVDEADGITTVVGGSDRLTVRVPNGTDVVVGTDSGKVEIKGRVGAVATTTTSGRIDIETATTVDARSSTGRIQVRHASGRCRIQGATGRIEIGGCGGADVSTETGRIELKGVNGPVHAHCVSGRIDVEMVDAHDVDAETISGRVEVALPRGTVVHHLRGRDDDTPQPEGCDCAVRATSVTGRVHVG